MLKSIAGKLLRVGGVAAALALAMMPSELRAKDDAPLDGEKLYLRYCSACHGESGKGDGVVSGFMTPHPTDLTQIAAANQGQFPFMAMVRKLDGRDSIRAHGDPEMPVWGEILRDPSRPGVEARGDVTGRLLLITSHLEKIQRE